MHYPCDLTRTFRVILFSVHNDEWKSFSVTIKQHCAKDMWKRVERLMRGTIQNKVDRETHFTNEIDQFVVEPGEALISKLVNTSRAKKLEKYHDLLALVAHKGSSSRNTSSYYVTHPTSVADYDDEYQQDNIQSNSKDPLTSAMLLLAQAITQNFSNPTNNCLRTSSNTRNQAVIQGNWVNIQSRNSGNDRRNNRRAYVQEEVVEGSNEAGNVQRILWNSSSGNTSTVHCYNYSGKGHYARNCPKPREIDELIAHVSEKTYAYGAIRAKNQNLLFIISELKTKLKNVEKGMNAASSVTRSMNRGSHEKNIILANFKNSAKQVAVYVRKYKQTYNTFVNVISNTENVIDVDVANPSKAKNLLYVSCMKNVLILCHDKCLVNHRLNMHLNARRTLSTNPGTPKSPDTMYVGLKTRFSEKLAQSKTLDTTSVVSKPKIVVGSGSKAKNKVVQIILWIVDSGCSKHMTGDRSLLRNFIKKFMGTVRFGNDNFATITGYGDYI
nr:integrase, catalytic region, zinc finger, CCHC-type, peptidase aspartic, catalytic [Tanacetum cinerariifolium]